MDRSPPPILLPIILSRPPKSVIPHVPSRTEPPAPAAGAAGPSIIINNKIKILSAGDMGVGKSCLIKRYCEQRFVGKYISTIGVDYGVKQVVLHNALNIKVNFWDLAGHPSFFDVRNEFYKDTQGMMLVFSVGSHKSFESLENWVAEAVKFGAEEPLIVAVCGNKTDTSKRVVMEQEARQWAEMRGYMYFETSASTGEGVTEMFESLFEKVLQKLQKNI